MSTPTPVRDVYLKNQGGYVCDMYVMWKNPDDDQWHEAHTATLSLGQHHTSNPGKHGADEGAQVGVGIHIHLGKKVHNHSAPLVFQSSAKVKAKFACAGTTQDPSLGFTGVS